MSVIITVTPLALPLIMAASVAPIAPFIFALGSTGNTATSSLNSEISSEYQQFVTDALKRVESLHGVRVSEWHKDFLETQSINNRLVFSIPYIEKTSLQTKDDIDLFLNLLSNEIQTLVQDKIYSDIIAKAESKGLELREETIEGEDTIVLTYRIP